MLPNQRVLKSMTFSMSSSRFKAVKEMIPIIYSVLSAIFLLMIEPMNIDFSSAINELEFLPFLFRISSSVAAASIFSNVVSLNAKSIPAVKSMPKITCKKRAKLKSPNINSKTSFTKLAMFVINSSPYFGATVGRYAGRINNSTFSLNGKSIDLNSNNNGHSLHGGNIGFSQKQKKTASK